MLLNYKWKIYIETDETIDDIDWYESVYPNNRLWFAYFVWLLVWLIVWIYFNPNL